MSGTDARSLATGRQHVPALDGVRGVAIALVMALHFVNNQVIPTTLVERLAIRATTYGLWGVDLFFVLSGFLITGILVDAKGRPGYFVNFFARRALRIFPLYYGVLLLFTVAVPAGLLAALDPELLQLREVRPWLWLYLTNVYLGPETTFSIPYLSHFWSLAVEEHFYLVWPFVIWYTSVGTAMRLSIALAALALALRIAFSIAAPDQLYAGVITPCRIDALCVGAWFALDARRAAPLGVAMVRRVAWISGLGVAALSVFFFALHLGSGLVLPLRTAILAVFFGALIRLASMRGGPAPVAAAFGQGWLRHLGRYSYGLYVFHGIVAYAMHRYAVPAWFETVTPLHPLNSLLMVASGIGASYVIAVASYHGFEMPFLALKKRFGPA